MARSVTRLVNRIPESVTVKGKTDTNGYPFQEVNPSLSVRTPKKIRSKSSTSRSNGLPIRSNGSDIHSKLLQHPFEWFSLPFERFLHLFERFSHPFERFLHLFERFSHPFERFLQPFAR